MDHEVDDAVTKIDRIAERRIQDAINAGEFDNLPGMGEPLPEGGDNPYTPADMRAAFKVLSNAGFAPDWMVLAQQVDAELAHMRRAADRHFAFLRGRLAEIAADPYSARRLRSEVSGLLAEHRRAAARHAEAIDKVNGLISSFNHTVPIPSLLKVPLAKDAEMEKFEDRLPAYLGY
jgi:hypothetical protein